MNNPTLLNPSIVLIRSLGLKWRALLSFFWFLTICLFIFLSIFCVVQLNKETSERYLIEKTRKEINNILTENKKMEIVFMQDNSLDNVIGLVEGLNFEKVDRLEHIYILGGNVVKR